MDENKEKQTAPQQEASPQQEKVDYSRYMGTLNRIYRRNANPQRKRLGDGIGSLKKDAAAPQPQPDPEQNGKKDYSFPIALAVSIGVILILWVIKNFPTWF